MNTVVISGYFNPIHKGHIEYINAARALGDELIVIVNNDHQQILKKGRIIMNESDRMDVVKALKVVDRCVLSIDHDRSVLKTLEMLAGEYDSLIFANGGDRDSDVDIPESVLAGRYNIRFIYGVGGYNKLDSSTNITSLMDEKSDLIFVPKSWGHEKWLVNNDLYCGKILHINKGHCSSYHFHKLKDETFYILKGHILLELQDSNKPMHEGDTIRLSPHTMHRLIAMEDSDVLEISTQHFDEDSYRVIDSDRPEEKISSIDAAMCSNS
jgi:cytidyltransferase-like protein